MNIKNNTERYYYVYQIQDYHVNMFKQKISNNGSDTWYMHKYGKWEKMTSYNCTMREGGVVTINNVNVHEITKEQAFLKLL